MRITDRYLLREISGLFSLSLLVITILFMSNRVIQLTEWAMNRGVRPADIVKFMLYLLPSVLMIVVPIVTLFSILLAIGRLSSDHEIIALKSSGVSLFRLFPAVLLFAVFTSALGLFISWELVPRSAFASRILRWRIVRTNTEAALPAQTFVKLLDRTSFYVREKKADGRLKGLLVAVEDWPAQGSWKSRQIVLARLGHFVHDPAALVNELWLKDGVMISEDRQTGREDFATFEFCRIRLELEKEKVKADERRQELGLLEMRREIAEIHARFPDKPGRLREERKKLAIQWHERFAFPLGCLALCFWAVPLGIQPPRAGRARAIVVSILLAAIFYYLMIMARFGALKGWASPPLMIWMPDLLIFLSGLYMLRQKNLERPVLVLSRLEDQLYYLADRIKLRREQRRGR